MTTLADQIAALPGSDTGSINDGDMATLLGGLLGGQDDSGANPPHNEASSALVVTDDTTDPAREPGGDAAAAPAPAPAPAPAAAPVPTPEEDRPVVLTKDGKHTIPFETLEDARRQATESQARADALQAQHDRLQAELDALRKAPPAAALAAAAEAATDAQGTEDENLFGDYSDAALKAGMLKLLEQRLGGLRQEIRQEIAPVAEYVARDEISAHEQAILSKHPDAHEVVASPDFASWKASMPSAARAAIEELQRRSTPDQMIEVLDSFRAAKPRAAAPAPAPAAAPAAAAGAPNAAALAARALEQAQSRTPTSLSDIPAGSQAVINEADAVRAMEPTALLDQMLSMTPEQRDAYIARMV